MTDEKRRYPRYSNHYLSLSVARPGIRGIIRTNPSAECMNFSLTGLQFDSPEQLTPGEKLLLDIEVGDVELHELHGEIVSSIETDGGNWCHGVRFCLEDAQMKKNEIHHALLLIEDKLKSADAYGS